MNTDDPGRLAELDQVITHASRKWEAIIADIRQHLDSVNNDTTKTVGWTADIISEMGPQEISEDFLAVLLVRAATWMPRED